MVFHCTIPFGRGFNEALNGFSDEGWSLVGNDGIDDVTVLVNSNPNKLMGLNVSFVNGYTSVSNAVLCAKASMLLQVSYYTLIWLTDCCENTDKCDTKFRNY